VSRILSSTRTVEVELTEEEVSKNEQLGVLHGAVKLEAYKKLKREKWFSPNREPEYVLEVIEE